MEEQWKKRFCNQGNDKRKETNKTGMIGFYGSIQYDVFTENIRKTITYP